MGNGQDAITCLDQLNVSAIFESAEKEEDLPFVQAYENYHVVQMMCKAFLMNNEAKSA